MNPDISSLMDGELETHSSDKIIEGSCSTPEGKQAWDTYHLIGEAMRGERCNRFDISKSVMAALDKEPTVLAPRPRAGGPTRTFTFGRVALAAAASVATIGVVGWIGTQGMTGRGPDTLAKGDPAVTMQANVPVAQAGNLAQPPFAAIEVNDYLAAHRQVPTPDQYRTVASRTVVQGR